MNRIFSFALLTVFMVSFQSFSQELHFGGNFEYKASTLLVDPISEEYRKGIHRENDSVIALLIERGQLDPTKFKAVPAEGYIFPLKAMNGLSDSIFHGISGYVDHNPAYPNKLLDYNGGNRTYDLSSGYNHAGTDFFSWPFPWYRKLKNQIAVVAVASGVITGKTDGNNDDNCSFNNNNWNAVYVKNFSGEKCWYGHMKKNTLTAKGIGDTVFSGDYLGIVGSSGSSTGPHLHFEVYDNNNTLIDPFFGPSNPSITSSWWQKQLPYYNSGINALLTHNSDPVFPDCPGIETINLCDTFVPGAKVFLGAYYRDQLQGQVTNFTVLKPDSTPLLQWQGSLNVPYYAASWWYWWFIFPSDVPMGNYQFIAEYEGKTYRHNFLVDLGVGVSNGEVSDKYCYHLSANYPNPFNPSTKLVYTIPEESIVTIEVFNGIGQRVQQLLNARLTAGMREVTFNGIGLPSGIYYCKMSGVSIARNSPFYELQKMMLLK